MSNLSNTKYILNLVIDSKYRNDYANTNSNNFTIPLTQKIKGKILRYGLKSCSIPNTINNITGSFEIEDSEGVKVITPTAGNYDANTFATELETVLNAAGVDTYTVVLVGNKYTITSSFNDFTINPNNISASNGILFKIGFGISGVYNATLGVLTSYSGINLSYPNYIFVDIGQFAKHIKNTNGVFHNFMIPNCTKYGGLISFSPENSFIQQFLPYQYTFQINVDTFTVSLRYENGELIDINNSDWVMVLDLEVVSNYIF